MCLEETVENREKCKLGFRRLTLALSESENCQGVFFSGILGQVGGVGGVSGTKNITVDIPEPDIQRWKLFRADEMNSAPLEYSGFKDRIRNFPKLDGIRKGKALYIGLAITGFVYGGLHCLAWNAPFATEAETILWRVSKISAPLFPSSQPKMPEFIVEGPRALIARVWPQLMNTDDSASSECKMAKGTTLADAPSPSTEAPSATAENVSKSLDVSIEYPPEKSPAHSFHCSPASPISPSY